MSGTRLLVAALVAGVLAGCPEPPREPAPLIDHGAWDDVSEGDHPFGDRALPASGRVCEDLAVYRELFGAEDTITVDLDACNHVVLTQLTATDVLPGEVFTLRLWRDAALFSTEDPMQVAVQVGDAFLYDEAFPAPGDSGLVFEQMTATEPLPAGAPVHFFVNSHRDLGARHGGNSLNLIELSRSDPGWEEPG